jgi:Poly(A) polymerase central domain/MJ1316 RNA cyclic group end recognition domain
VTLNAYRDLLTLKKVIPSLDQFRLAHRSLKLFLTLRGLWGARFGYLGGFHLTLLLTHVALSLPKNAQATHLIESFIKTYAEWDWSKDIVYPIPSCASDATSLSTYRRVLSKEPMVVLSIQRPLSNLTSHASRNSVETLSQGFQHAHSALTQGKSWFNICGVRIQEEVTTKSALNEFVNGHRHFIKLNVHFWGGNDMKGRALIGWLESRIVNVRPISMFMSYAEISPRPQLLVQVHQNVPDILVQFWPERLVDQSTIDPVARDPNGFYLFGLSALPTSDNVARSGDHMAKRNSDAQSALSSCLRTFEHGLRTNERFYNEAEAFISLVNLKQGQIPSKIVPDPFKWQDDGFDAPLDDEEDEIEGSPEPSAMAYGAGSANDWDDFRAPSSAQRKREAVAAKSKSTPHIRAGKLRTSSDVYNRLIWDSTGAVSKTDYCIGYEDRFKGIKETPLTAWKREVEDESFVSARMPHPSLETDKTFHRSLFTGWCILNDFRMDSLYGIDALKST